MQRKLLWKKKKYQITCTHDELLAIVNGLGARAQLIREINSIILDECDKKKQKGLEKLHRTLAEALPPDVWSGKK